MLSETLIVTCAQPKMLSETFKVHATKNALRDLNCKVRAARNAIVQEKRDAHLRIVERYVWSMARDLLRASLAGAADPYLGLKNDD